MGDQPAVVIIGGGPAGLAAGIVLASNQIPTALFERDALPRDKPCGEGIMPTGVRFLQRYAVDTGIDRDQVFPFQGITYRAFRRSQATGTFREGCGWGMPRKVLSNALFQRASQIENLEIYPNTQPDVTIDDHGRVNLQTKYGQLHPRLVIGADGLTSTVRKSAGIRELSRHYHRWGVRQHFSVKPWSQNVEIYWEDGIEAYVTPCGPELIDIAFLWDRSRIKPSLAGKSVVAGFLKYFPELIDRLGGAQSYDPPMAVGPLERRIRGPAADGILLMGDAAGYLDAITGEGISLAFAQAVALERTVVPLLREKPALNGSLTKADLSPYASAYRQIVFPYQCITRLLLALSTRPLLVERIIDLLNRRPTLFQVLLSLNMGIPPWRRIKEWQKSPPSEAVTTITREH